MKKKLINLKGVKNLSRHEQKAISGGIFSVYCLSYPTCPPIDDECVVIRNTCYHF